MTSASSKKVVKPVGLLHHSRHCPECHTLMYFHESNCPNCGIGIDWYSEYSKKRRVNYDTE